MKQRIVVKIGSSTLTGGTNRISRGKLEDLAKQIIELQDEYEIILVSSGAIATARQFINSSGWDNEVTSKQALSAIGQPKLMQLYNEVFSDYELRTAQCLMTYRDFEHPESKKNTENTLLELIGHNYIPIVNENDTTAVEELVLGDNDKLSALVAILLKADKLIIASDIDGLYTKNPHLYDDAELIHQVNDLSSAKKYIQERDNGIGTGGMTSKINAVELCFNEDIPVTLINGNNSDFIQKALKNSTSCTHFIP
ncbi:MAG TPA: glutamate 5-kinase [Balneolaceae bacterium]|nr:glutamate 5-kinase [Balneolaceae bacterium]|tara:strand:- start:25344 stop:26105 length:762 start_codon:yes stop_codon:yes gene_type:complete